MNNKYVGKGTKIDVVGKKVSFKGNKIVQSDQVMLMNGKKRQGKVLDTVIDVDTKLNFETQEVNGKEVFVSGENVKNRTVKRGYFKSNEINNFMTITAAIHLIEGVRNFDHKISDPMWKQWENSGIITKEQQKNLKMAVTYLSKFANDVFNNNLDSTSKQTISDKMVKYDFRLIDDPTVQRLYSMLSKDSEAHITKEEFFDLVESKMHCDCHGCTKDRANCETRIFLENNFIPPINSEEDACNCEYSYYFGGDKDEKNIKSNRDTSEN